MSGLQRIPVTIVLPVYKPPAQWSEQFTENIKELREYLPSAVQLEYIVVYDGTPDPVVVDTFHAICTRHKEIKFTWYRKNHGKGYALRHGVRMANSPNILTIDFDFPYQKESVGEMIRLLQQGHDIIVGKRSNRYFQQIPLKRKVISKIFSWVTKTFLGLSLKDTQSGIKGFNEKSKPVFLETIINRFLVDTEFILRASKKNLNVKTIQIEPKPGLSFTNFGLTVIKTELVNFIKLLYLNRTLTKTT
jgi:dolichyl-phosphate beta-glucosyltransferase